MDHGKGIGHGKGTREIRATVAGMAAGTQEIGNGNWNQRRSFVLFVIWLRIGRWGHVVTEHENCWAVA